MALDRTFGLLSSPLPGALSGPEIENLRPWEEGWTILRPGTAATLDAAGWGKIALLVRPGGSVAKAALELSEEASGIPNPYEILHRNGILVVGPVRTFGECLQLSGGSYSSVTLRLEDGVPLVHKRLEVGSDQHPDREGRQLQECMWVSRLPPRVAELFPPMVSTSTTGSAFELVTEFVPGYSLGEMVFQRRIEADRLAELLEHIYTQVSDRIWSLDPIPVQNPGAGETYLQRINRRLAKIENSDLPSGSPLRELLSSCWIEVNGRRCPTVTGLLTMLRQARWGPIVRPRARTLCHGDLILEDIVIDELSPLGFCLVDPNPGNTHPVFDVCKTMMSLWLCYEPIYYDRFSIEALSRDGGTAVSLQIEDLEVAAAFSAAGDRFAEFAELTLAPWLELSRREFRALLRMGAAINMLAIPMFHLLHHRNERRALAFLAQSLWHARQAMSEIDELSALGRFS